MILAKIRFNTYGIAPQASLHGKQAIEFCINHVGHLLEMLRIVAKLTVVAIDNDELPLIRLNPVLVATAQALQLVQAHGLLIFTATLLYLSHQRRNA